MILINKLINNIYCSICKSNVNKVNNNTSYNCNCDYLSLKYIEDDECELYINNLIISLTQSQECKANNYCYGTRIIDYYKHHIIINNLKEIYNISVHEIIRTHFNLQEMFLNRINFLIDCSIKIERNLLFI